jgi:hypothetical protein
VRPPIGLQHLVVEFNIHYRILVEPVVLEDRFVVISLRDDDLALSELFCVAAEALVATLPELPTPTDIEEAVRSFVELLSALTVPSPRAVAGLWGELWLLSVAEHPSEAVSAWHRDATDRLDFSFPTHAVEVKATEREERAHEFSYEQLRGVGDHLRVASLKLRRAEGGKSIPDLIAEIQPELPPLLRAKLVKNVFGALGDALSEASHIRFDPKFAEANLRLIAGEDVPVVAIPPGSAISGVRFRVNFDDSSVKHRLRRVRPGQALHLAASV